jgi:hypothetical protein
MLGAVLLLYKDRGIQWKGTNVPSARVLQSYCELARDRSLFILQPDDEYFSAVLPLRKVFYGIIGHGSPQPHLAIDWRALGVVVTQEEFDDQAKWWPIYQIRLAGIGLDLDGVEWRDPRGTVVLIRDESAAADFISSHPELDFLVPKAFARDPGKHYEALSTGEREFLISTTVSEHTSEAPPWSCQVGAGLP